MSNGKGKRIVSKSSRKGVKSYLADKAKKEKKEYSGIPRGGKKSRKPVSGISYAPQYYDYAQEGFFGEDKNQKGYVAGKKDMDRIPFRNSAISRLSGKTSRK